MKRLAAGTAVFALAGAGSAVLAGPAVADEDEIEVDVVVQELGATLAPNPTAPGAEVTVTPDEPCVAWQDGDDLNDYLLHWGLLEAGTFTDWDFEELPALDQDTAEVDADGNWSVTLVAPADAGSYEFIGYCAPAEVAEDVVDVVEDEADAEIEVTEEVVAQTETHTFGERDRGRGRDRRPGKFRCGWKDKDKEEEPPVEEEPPAEEEPPVEEEPEPVVVGVYGPLDLVVEVGDAPPAPPVTGQPDFTG